MINLVTQFISQFKSKLFLIYWGRWMLSAIVMMPFMITLEYLSFPLWINLLIGQSIGSIIFFKIDGWIFKGKEAHTYEDELKSVENAIHDMHETP